MGPQGEPTPRLRCATEAAALDAVRDTSDVDVTSLQTQVARLEVALDNMSQGLCMFDHAARLVICNARYHELFEIPPLRLRSGMSQEDVCAVLIAHGCYPPSVTVDAILETTRASLQAGGAMPILRELVNGRVLSILFRPLKDGGWVSTFEDVTEQRRSAAKIAHLAGHDALTDLANARALREEGRALMAQTSALAPVLAMHYLDLDRFKFVNDTHGHEAGDELLRLVAGRLQAVLRRGDRIGRLGGDEFAILQRVPTVHAALEFATLLVDAVSAPFGLSVGPVAIGASVGTATRVGLVEDLEPLLHEADLALRQAKLSGRGTTTLFDPEMSDLARQRRSLEAELHVALAAEQFELHYQPLVSLDRDRNRIVGVEALVRWRHPVRGLVSPATFISIAEETGLIVPLGAWVLGQACRDAAGWPAHVVVAVNVSSMQMRHKAFAADVFAILEETGLAPARLEIEITESALLDESDTIMDNLNRLRSAGIRFAMDDFGTGYSSLSYLRRFPFDKIKIDRSFMQDAETSADALAIIRAVAGLGASLGITTLVEGVETAQQLAMARAEGVGQAQGYLLSRPQPGAVIADLLKQDRLPGD
ncbi:EAL domain-containing protein [Lichenihabitans sp. Uapishka_5]|uniref:putative bifunctional diguanylate cyclase/phosphodiesterase n=1 Tax=Lichenihabitans sp. Uapishka_5 TaxID=3037302 RepID=UPI0029E7E4A5|nr:EAL domain-containing protein [Lichenihabitans sp. Uapishka_5]MDX7953353.1 EAL domain-containing protein [Lichenihabitans sp. Uapishka_5]